jgi:hypothetical protein
VLEKNRINDQTFGINDVVRLVGLRSENNYASFSANAAIRGWMVLRLLCANNLKTAVEIYV